MEEYLDTLLEQVRCKKAHGAIREEIADHIREQMQAYLADGLTDAEAEEAAVRDMGSPVEAGVSLDRIHRPKMAWGMIGFMAAVTLAAILVHAVLGTPHFAVYAVVGFLLMVLFCRLDYTVIACRPRMTAVLYFVFCGLMFRTAVSVRGTMYWMNFGLFSVSLFSFLLLYVPLYGALLYPYYGQGYRGLFKALLWMAPPVVLAMQMPNLFLALLLVFSMGVVLLIAVAKDWFAIPGGKKTIAFWGMAAGGLVLLLISSLSFAPGYRAERLRAFLTNSGEANYVTSQIRSFLAASSFVGGCGMEIDGVLPECDSSFIFTYLIADYGILAGLLVCAALVFLAVRLFSISLGQRNRPGMLMGAGSAVILSVNIAVNLLENVGLFPVSQTFLPFFSAGGGSLLVSYIMTGIVLSVYRYKNVYAEHVKRKGRSVGVTADPD